MKKYNLYGCHYTVLLTIVEEKMRETFPEYTVDFVEATRLAMSKGYIDSDFYVHDALGLLHFFTGCEWTRRKVNVLPPVIKDNEWTECHWYNKRTGLEHFTRRSINSLLDSVTVKEGVITYYYIYTCKE